MERIRGNLLAVGILLIVLMCTVSCNHEPGPEDFLDHFKVYKVIDIGIDETVHLRGQFDTSEKEVHLSALTHFANPVSKNKKPILDPASHQTWYILNQDATDPLRTVEFDNQFGLQKCVIDQPQFLIVPAEKNNGGYPVKPDHYKVYEIVDPIEVPEEEPLELEDQWGYQDTNLGEMKFFCVPVKKRRPDGETATIYRDELFLVVYEIDRVPVGLDEDLLVEDQFMEDNPDPLQSLWLCVPTHLKGFTEE